MLPEPMRIIIYLLKCPHRSVLCDDEYEPFWCEQCDEYIGMRQEELFKVGTVVVRLNPQTGDLVADADGWSEVDGG